MTEVDSTGVAVSSKIDDRVIQIKTKSENQSTDDMDYNDLYASTERLK